MAKGIDKLSVEERETQLREITRLKVEVLRKMREYKETHGSEYFKPYEYQERFLELITGGKKVVVLQGSNQIGKTMCGAILMDTFCNCRQAFDWRGRALERVFGNRPIKARIVASDWEHSCNEVIVPKLKEIVVKGTYVTRKNNIGVEAFWQFKTGSTIELMTHSQETKYHEGWTGDVVWADEPIPQDKFIANRRGLVARGGVFIMTMTAISEPWIMDEIILSNRSHIGVVTEIPMRANKSLTEEDIKNFEDDIPADQRLARIEGGWLQLIGRVLKEFNKDIHVIDQFKIPPDWPVTPFIDIHLNKPQAVSFYAVDKHGRRYVIDEIWENISPEEIADEIIRRKVKNAWDIDTVFIDPLAKGDSAYVKNRGLMIEDSFTIIANKLAGYQIQLLGASKDKDSGVRNIKTWLQGINKMPVLFFFNSLPSYDGAYGHLYEINRWIYDKEGKPAKECVVGSTLIDTPSGQFPIEDLIGQEIWVYSYSLGKNLFDVKKANQIRKTKEKAEIWKLTMDRGVLFATPDHLILLKNGTYKPLRELKSYDSIMSLYRTMSADGYSDISSISGKGYEPRKEHRFVYESIFGNIPEGYEVHHKSGDYLNHNPENLECLTPHEHQLKHNTENLRQSKCKCCGNIFQQKRTWHRYCSNKCRQKMGDEKRGIIREENRKCFYCGKKFKIEPHKGKQLYCSITCRNYHFREARGLRIINHKVISAAFYGYKDTYNMEVEENHNFVANGIVVHNCDHFMENLYRYTLAGIEYQGNRDRYCYQQGGASEGARSMTGGWLRA